MALESFSPLALIGFRFTTSGAILLLAAILGGAHVPRGRELWVSTFTGLLTCGIGTGSLAYAEDRIPSSLAALIIAFSPFWMVGIEALMPGGERLRRSTVAGLLVGSVGAGLLVSSGVARESVGGATTVAFIMLQIGSVSWAFGSIYQRRQTTRAHPIITGAIQQLSAGLVFLALTLVIPARPIMPGFRGIAALGYLVVFGSIIGYSAYIYAMSHLRVAVVSIYSYVNPVVAVALGWLFYREPFGPREALATAIIFSGVALVKRYGKSE
jgi:drug/metabolite transporter (DMT)-like permease